MKYLAEQRETPRVCFPLFMINMLPPDLVTTRHRQPSGKNK